MKTVNLGDDLKNGISRRNQDLAGRVAYNWAYRYFVNFNFGYNGSENFAKHNRFGFFPAASVAWNVAEESFVKKNLKWMNMFKVRFSYGKVGNDNMGVRFPYLYTIANKFKIGDNEYTYGGYNWAKYGSSNSYNGLSMPNLGSPLVTWEVATKKTSESTLPFSTISLRVLSIILMKSVKAFTWNVSICLPLSVIMVSIRRQTSVPCAHADSMVISISARK